MHSTELAPVRGQLRPGDACANCAATLTGPYCAQCGQHAHVETPTLWEFVHEYLHHYVALEGKLGRSLWLLLLRPGRLTLEYLAGRRARYVKPLQMYLTFSVVFFVAMSLFGVNVNDSTPKGPRPEAGGAQVQAEAPAPRAAPDSRSMGLEIESDSAWAKKWNAALQARQDEFRADRDKTMRRFAKQVLSYAPYGVFFLLPIFALLLQGLYFGRRQRYGAHLVFALHTHAFVFLVFNVMLLPLPGWFDGLLLAVLPVYFLAAMKTMYGGRWWALLPRATLLAVVYAAVALVTTLGLLVLALLA